MSLAMFAPVRPDLSCCAAEYGERLSVRECSNARSQLPVGDEPIPYIVGGTEGSYILPWTGQDGGCVILLEKAGPATGIERMTLVPNEIRGMVGHIINNCVAVSGRGGFVTGQFGNLQRYIIQAPTNYLGPFPSSSSFFTVTVSSISGDDHPGDRDPVIPIRFKKDLDVKARAAPPHLRQAYAKDARAMRRIVDVMVLSGLTVPWWQASVGAHEMTYECDSKLGSPHATDCFHLEYSALGAPSDSIKVTPGVPKILSSNICSVAITSSLPIFLTWKQIRAALDTLIRVCLKHPLQRPVGGKAFYGPQVSSRQAGMSRGIKKRKSPDIAGLNALPPHVNITLYEPGARLAS